MLIDTSAKRPSFELDRHDFTKCVFSWQAGDSLIRAIAPTTSSSQRQVLICASDPFELIQAMKLENQPCKDSVTYCGFLTDFIVCLGFKDSNLVKLIDLSFQENSDDSASNLHEI